MHKRRAGGVVRKKRVPLQATGDHVTDALDIEPPGADLDVIEVIEQSTGDHRRLSFRGRQVPNRRQAPVERVARRQIIDRFGGVAGLAGMLVAPAENAYEAW